MGGFYVDMPTRRVVPETYALRESHEDILAFGPHGPEHRDCYLIYARRGAALVKAVLALVPRHMVVVGEPVVAFDPLNDKTVIPGLVATVSALPPAAAGMLREHAELARSLGLV
jgi:hypothetical protein